VDRRKISDNLYIRLVDFIYKCDKLSTDFYIAKFLLDNLDKFPDLTSQEVAMNAFTSKGSVTKFCKKLGYESFFDLRHDQEKLSKEAHLFHEIQSDNPQKSIQNFIQNSYQLDLKIFSMFDYHQIIRIASLIQSANSVALISPAFTFESVNLLKEVLHSSGYRVFLLNRSTPVGTLLDMADEADLSIFISMTGQWMDREKVEQLERIKDKSVLITTNLNERTHSHKDSFKELVILDKTSFSSSNFISTKLYTNYFVALLYYLDINEL